MRTIFGEDYFGLIMIGGLFKKLAKGFGDVNNSMTVMSIGSSKKSKTISKEEVGSLRAASRNTYGVPVLALTSASLPLNSLSIHIKRRRGTWGPPS